MGTTRFCGVSDSMSVLHAIWTWWKLKAGLLTAFSASIFFFGLGVGRVQPEYSITVAELDIEAEGAMAPVADALAYILVQITSVGVDVGSYLMVVPAPIVTNGARLLGAVVVVVAPLLYFKERVKNLR